MDYEVKSTESYEKEYRPSLESDSSGLKGGGVNNVKVESVPNRRNGNLGGWHCDDNKPVYLTK